jgi:hypothetical protein
LTTADVGVTNETTTEFLQNYMTEFHAFIRSVYTALARNTVKQ